MLYGKTVIQMHKVSDSLARRVSEESVAKLKWGMWVQVIA
jgi:hypothetical protein